MEKKLADIWQTVLGIERVGINDHYVALGGDSLKAVRIVSRLRQMNLVVTVADVFRCQTIAGLIQHIESNGPSGALPENTGRESDETAFGMFDMKPVSDDALNCFENLVATVARWWRLDYEMMLSNTWNFSFRSGDLPEGSLSDRIELNRGDFWGLLKQYHRLEPKAYYDKPMAELKPLIHRELEARNPVAVNIDNYWCPWENTGYQNIHFQHLCLVIGFSEKKRMYYCLDPSLSQTMEELPAGHLEQGCNGIITFTRLGEDQQTPMDWRQVVTSAVNRLKSGPSTAFSQMRVMADNLLKYFGPDLAALQSAENIAFTGIYQKLTEIIRGRRQFFKLLQYLAERFQVSHLEELAARLRRVSFRWESVRANILQNPKTRKRYSLKRLQYSGKSLMLRKIWRIPC